MDLNTVKYAIPSAITLLRLAAAPLFFFVFQHCSCVLAFAVFVLAALTDVLDGFAARKLGAASNGGAFLDAFVDFILVVFVFLAFFYKAWYCRYVLYLILLFFFGFIASSSLKRPVYDPVGKYAGAFLMVMIVLSLLLPYPIVRKALTILLTFFCVISLSSRVVFLCRKHEERRIPH